MTDDGFIRSLSASERCCDAIVCSYRSTAVVSLVFAKAELMLDFPGDTPMSSSSSLFCFYLLVTDYHNSVLTTERRVT
jgi:hypothetical protein